jgi:DHA2 family multidrug resistance protein
VIAESQTSSSVSLKTWAGFGLMSLGMFMAILDIQIVATALPTIQAGLHIAPDQMSWIQTAYLIAEVIAIPLTGLLTRIFSMRWLFVLAVSCFTCASLGCALSSDFMTLIGWRILQGFAGGTLIPSVFSAVFLLFPPSKEAFATTLAGVLAVLAPTVGPAVGGWITQTYSWHWLFLINIGPGVLAAMGAALLLPRGCTLLKLCRTIDVIGILLLAVALASFELGLKQAPDHGWLSLQVGALFGLSLVTMMLFIRRSLQRTCPVVSLGVLGDGRVALGCLLSFALGFGLYGSSYLIPLFLALVRGHNALEIGKIMLVTGCAQLATAPLAVYLEKRVPPVALSTFGFGLFGIGLALSGFQTSDSDFQAMLVPQIVRGSAIMFCLLPPTRLALGHLPMCDVPNASGLFNLMRNLGGAIGLALIDTVIYGRAPALANGIADRLRAGDVATAKAVGLPMEDFLAYHGEALDADTQALIEPLVRKLALTYAVNEAWLVIAAITLSALLWIACAMLWRPNGRANNRMPPAEAR